MQTFISTVASVLLVATIRLQFAIPAALAAPARPLDLAAMVLQPGDLPDHGYGVFIGAPLTVEDIANTLINERGSASYQVGDEGRYIQELSNAGWVAAQVQALVQPDPNNPSLPVSTVNTQVIEFATATGAAKGFALLGEASRGLPGTCRQTPSARVGDQAYIISNCNSGTETAGPPRVFRELTFQDNELIADVGVSANGANAKPPTDSTVLRLAATLDQRMADVRQGRNVPNLGNSALLFSGSSTTTLAGRYERLDGVTIPANGESLAAFTARDNSYKVSNVTDVYSARQYIASYGTKINHRYWLRVQRFIGQADAESWLRRVTPASITADGAPTIATEVASAPRLGDASLTYRYTTTRPDDDSTASGYVIITRIGRTVASVQIDSGTSVRLATVDMVAAAQVDCLTGGECRTPLAPPRLPATPAAASLPPDRAAGVL